MPAFEGGTLFHLWGWGALTCSVFTNLVLFTDLGSRVFQCSMLVIPVNFEICFSKKKLIKRYSDVKVKYMY